MDLLMNNQTIMNGLVGAAIVTLLFRNLGWLTFPFMKGKTQRTVAVDPDALQKYAIAPQRAFYYQPQPMPQAAEQCVPQGVEQPVILDHVYRVTLTPEQK